MGIISGEEREREGERECVSRGRCERAVSRDYICILSVGETSFSISFYLRNSGRASRCNRNGGGSEMHMRGGDYGWDDVSRSALMGVW